MNAPSPQSSRWPLVLLAAVACLVLLLLLPYPYGNLVFGTLLMGAGLISAWSALFPPHSPPVVKREPVFGVLALFLKPPAQFLRAWIAFHRSEAGPVKPLRWAEVGRRLTAVVFAAGVILVLLVLPQSNRFGLFLVGVTVGAGLLGYRTGADLLAVPRWLVRQARDTLTGEQVAVRAIPRPQVVVEVGLMLLLALSATGRFSSAGPGVQLSGYEVEWLTNSVYTAHKGLQDYGRIPLWQPWLEMGEPLLDNPFGMVLNPFSSGPSLLLGGAEGLKYSVVLAAVLAGVGGWFLGWVLGLSWPGRLLLGGLLISKGNMHAMFNSGYFQLAMQQPYFPWVLGGFMAIFRQRHQRWPLVLTALAFTLMYFVGNLWYLLPTLITMAALTPLYIWKPLPPNAQIGPPEKRNVIQRWLRWLRCHLDGDLLRRVALTGALTVGLSLIILLPMAVNWKQLTRHPSEVKAGWEVPLWSEIVPRYFDPEIYASLSVLDVTKPAPEPYYLSEMQQFYYSYSVPFWFAALLLVGLPWYRPRHTPARRFWLVAWLMLILFTQWGAGGQPIWLWLYEHFEFLRGWRFVGRALAAATFFLVVLVAMRADNLWQSIRATDWAGYFPRGSWWGRILPLGLAVLLIGGGGLAVRDVSSYWNVGKNILKAIHPDDRCVTWLRQQYPEQHLSVWRSGYEAITTYLNNEVRSSIIYADFEMSPVPSTIGKTVLTLSLPEYGIAWTGKERGFLQDRGYRRMSDSPIMLESGQPCLYHKADTLSYAYTAARIDLLDNQEPSFPVEKTVPITPYWREPDTILLVARNGDRPLTTVVTVQERAYPGWTVTVDGQPAKLESVGGQIGVVLPRDDREHVVYFAYRPPLLFLGGLVTLLTAGGCALYLLRVDRFIRRRR